MAGLFPGCPNWATSHRDYLRSDQGCMCTPNQMHFGLSVASPRLLLTTKLIWKCPHHCEYRGRNHCLTEKNACLFLATPGNSMNVYKYKYKTTWAIPKIEKDFKNHLLRSYLQTKFRRPTFTWALKFQMPISYRKITFVSLNIQGVCAKYLWILLHFRGQ